MIVKSYKDGSELRQIILKYYCPNLDKVLSKNINEWCFTYTHIDHPRYDDELDVDLLCKCGKTHDFNLR